MPYGRYRRRYSGYRRKRFAPRRYGTQSRAGAYRAHSRLAVAATLQRRKLASVARIAEAGIGSLTDRFRSAGAVLTAGPSHVQYSSHVGWNRDRMKDALSQLWIFDPANPSIPDVLDGNTFGSFRAMDFTFLGGMCSIFLRNTCKVPAKVRVYLCKCRDETPADTTSAIQEGVNTGIQPIGTLSSTPLYFPTDSATFKFDWSIEKHWDAVLQPGGSFTRSWKIPAYVAASVPFDSNTTLNQRQYQSMQWLVRLEGELGHQEVVNSVVARSAASLDSYLTHTMRLKYEAGASYEYIRIVDLMSDDVTPVVIGNKNQATNQLFYCGADDPPFNPDVLPPP